MFQIALSLSRKVKAVGSIYKGFKIDMFKVALSTLESQKVPLHCPPLEDVARVLEGGFKKNFSDACVQVVDCPDLTQAPFLLASPGLSGNPMVSDVGGVPYLIPTVKPDKRYDLKKVAEVSGLPEAFIVGAGAGPAHVVGSNAEMAVNVKFGETRDKDIVMSRVCKIDRNPAPNQKRYLLERLSVAEACVLVNLFLSDGTQGKVIEVKASNRTGPENFMSCARKALAAHYGDKPVSVGGAFCIEKGKCKMHVMPDFSKDPIMTDEDMENWLQYFEMFGPLTCLGYVISSDPGLDLRMEHFHGYSEHGDGGHYHYDTTPQQVQYRAYLNVAKYMVRVDRPSAEETHMVGRD